MKRQVFFSFHYQPDSWRASQVRNTGALDGNEPFSDNAWEQVKRGGDRAIERWIAAQMNYRSCTVVLVGKLDGILEVTKGGVDRQVDYLRIKRYHGENIAEGGNGLPRRRFASVLANDVVGVIEADRRYGACDGSGFGRRPDRLRRYVEGFALRQHVEKNVGIDQDHRLLPVRSTSASVSSSSSVIPEGRVTSPETEAVRGAGAERGMALAWSIASTSRENIADRLVPRSAAKRLATVASLGSTLSVSLVTGIRTTRSVTFTWLGARRQPTEPVGPAKRPPPRAAGAGRTGGPQGALLGAGRRPGLPLAP